MCYTLKQRKRSVGEQRHGCNRHAGGFAADGDHHCMNTADLSTPCATWWAEHQEDGAQNKDTLWRHAEANRCPFASPLHGESPWKNRRSCNTRLSSTSDVEWEKTSSHTEQGRPVCLAHPRQITTIHPYKPFQRLPRESWLMGLEQSWRVREHQPEADAAALTLRLHHRQHETWASQDHPAIQMRMVNQMKHPILVFTQTVWVFFPAARRQRGPDSTGGQSGADGQCLTMAN